MTWLLSAPQHNIFAPLNFAAELYFFLLLKLFCIAHQCFAKQCFFLDRPEQRLIKGGGAYKRKMTGQMVLHPPTNFKIILFRQLSCFYNYLCLSVTISILCHMSQYQYNFTLCLSQSLFLNSTSCTPYVVFDLPRTTDIQGS